MNKSEQEEQEKPAEVSGSDLVLVIIAVIAFLIPLVLLQTHRDNDVVQFWFGGWKFIVYYLVVFGVLRGAEKIFFKR